MMTKTKFFIVWINLFIQNTEIFTTFTDLLYNI